MTMGQPSRGNECRWVGGDCSTVRKVWTAAVHLVLQVQRWKADDKFESVGRSYGTFKLLDSLDIVLLPVPHAHVPPGVTRHTYIQILVTTFVIR